MFKLVVLSALVAIAVAKPSGVLVGSPVVAYSAPLIAHVPSAVSHTYRKDVISEPVVASVVAAPVVHAPVYEKIITPVHVPAAVSHSYRSDVISEPVVAAYAAPAWSYAHAPAIHAW